MFRMMLANGGRRAASSVGTSSKLGKSAAVTSTTTRREMCGLFGAIEDVWTTKTKPAGSSPHPILVDEELLTKTTTILNHRGPDGYQIANGTLGGNTLDPVHWSMGHTRLAIVDPSNRFADMPFHLTFDHSTSNGRKKTIHLAANGEIYNHEKIYTKLRNDDSWPHERISGSDCEMIGHAYAKYGGPETAKMLDGMFAFVIFEEEYAADGKTIENVNCFAARDPVGIKPLYYGKTKATSNSPSTYLFSSELKALVGQVDPSTVVNVPPGHYFTPETGLVCFYNPEWLRNVSCLHCRYCYSYSVTVMTYIKKYF